MSHIVVTDLCIRIKEKIKSYLSATSVILRQLQEINVFLGHNETYAHI